MQIDTWLTDTSYPDRCPLCSQPLAAGSNTCPSCGFTAHEPVEKAFSPVRPSISRSANPLTPIPARASARRTQSRPSGGTNRGKGVAPAARASAQTAPQGEGWQHESPSYEAVSSLSALSLIISETPTAPPRTPRSTGQLEHIDEIDTVPESSGRTQAVQRVSDKVQAIVPVTPEIPSGAYPLRLEDLVTPDTAQKFAETHLTPPFSHIDEIDTVPETGSVPSGALVPSGSREVAVDASSWTAGPGSTSLAAHFIASRSPRRRKRKSAFNPVDRTRWWLLRPGHMEFALWTVGSILLFGITFLLLLATVLSLIVPGLGLGGKFSTSSATPVVMTPARTSALTSSLHLTLQGTTSVSPGAELHLQGSGFHPRSKVVFLLDGHLPLLDQQGRTASTQANSAGSFEVKVWLGQGAAWSAGSHQIFAREPVSSHQAVLAITILSVSAPVLPGTTGGQNPPVASVSPTPTPEQPDPTPGQPTATATTPEPTPTDQPPGSTPTAASSPSPQPTHFAPTAPVVTAAPGHGTPAGSSALGNDVNTTDDSSLMTRLLHLNPLVWLIVTCYFVSMVLLGLAGLLRRRRQ